jgi:hypothetical protein
MRSGYAAAARAQYAAGGGMNSAPSSLHRHPGLDPGLGFSSAAVRHGERLQKAAKPRVKPRATMVVRDGVSTYRRALNLIAVLGMLSGCQESDNATSMSRFAISCTGKITFEDNSASGDRARTSVIGPDIYVVDLNVGEVLHALPPRQEFERVCARGKTPQKADASPGLVQVDYHDYDSINFPKERVWVDCSFKLDRETGTVLYYDKVKSEDGIEFGETREMTCTKSEIPVFDSSRNKI